MNKRIIYPAIFLVVIATIIAVYMIQKSKNHPDLSIWTKKTSTEKAPVPPGHLPSSLRANDHKPNKPLTKEEIIEYIQEKKGQMTVQQESEPGPEARAALEERRKQMAIQEGTLTESEARRADREKRKKEREARRKEREAEREARKKAREERRSQLRQKESKSVMP